MDQRTGVSTNLSGCWKETKRRNFLPDLDMINHYTTTKGLDVLNKKVFIGFDMIPILVVTLIF